MSTSFLFKTLTFNQIISPFFHIPCYILDTIPLLLLLFQIPLKIKLIAIPSFLTTLPQSILTKTISISIISCFTVLILIYNLIFIITKNIKIELSNSKLSKFFKYFILFYDLIIFRYFSSIMLFIYSDLIIKSINSQSLGWIIFTFISLIEYILTMYYHIYMIYILVHADNKEMIKSSILYPFDEYSKQFDMHMLAVKITGYIQYTSNSLQNDNNDLSKIPNITHYLSFSSSYIFIALIGYSFLELVVNDLFIKYRADMLLINTKLNIIRIGIQFFNIYTLILMFIFINDTVPLTIGSSLFVILISLIWTISSMAILWNKVIIPSLFDGELTIRKIAFIILKEFPKANCSYSFMSISSSRMMNSFKLHHFINCKERCKVCILYHDGFTNVFSYLNFFHLLNKNNMIIQTKNTDPFLISLLNLLYFRFKMKPYTYYRQYHKKAINSERLGVQELFINYIDLLFASFTNINNYSNNVSLYYHITSLSSLNTKIHSLLSLFKDFINLEKHNQIEQMFNLSSQLVTIEKEAQVVSDTQDNKSDNDSNDQMTKKIKNIYQYNMMINKYIIEKILNRTLLSSNNPIDSDQLIDYFTSHFENDNFLMLSINKSCLNKESLSNIMILKSGHALIEYESKGFEKIIPNKLEKEANNLFVSLIREYGAESHHNKSFDFIINDRTEHTVSYIKYKYDLLHLIHNDTLLVYGFYTIPEINIILFENTNYDTDNLILWKYSESIKSLLMIPYKAIDIAKEINFYFTLANMFKFFKPKPTREVNNMNKIDFVLECVLDYTKYGQLLQQFLNKCNSFYSSNNHCLYEELTNSISKIHSKNKKEIKLIFTLLCMYSEVLVFSIKLFSKTYQDNMNTNDGGDFKENLWETIGNNGNNNSENKTVNSKTTNTKNNNNVNNLANFTHDLASHSFLTEENSMSTTLSTHIKNRRENKLQLITLHNSIDNKTSKSNQFKNRFILIMKVIIWFNIFIILLCFCFLIIQIIQLRSLFAINSLYTQLKQMKIIFSHVILAIYANVCIGNSNDSTCINGYEDYSRQMLMNSRLKDLGKTYYSINFYIAYELKYKTQNVLSKFREIKAAFYTNGDKDVTSIFSQEMNFTQLTFQNEHLSSEHVVLTFEQGLKNSFNSMQIIQTNIDYISAHRVFRLIYAKEKIDFSYVVPQLLDQVQNELYSLIINYLNYNNVFNQGEDRLLNKFKRNQLLDKFILITQIATIFILNLVLFLLCLYGFSLTRKLVFEFCIEINILLSNIESKAFFESRIDNLIIINRLYVKNPNGLIKNIAKAEETQIRKAKQLHRAKSQKIKELQLQAQSQHEKSSKAKLSCFFNSTQKEEESAEVDNQQTINKIIHPYSKVAYKMFVCFFIFYITFFYFVFTDFIQVLDLAKYVQLSYQFENNIYTSIGTTQIMSLLTMTDRDVATEIGVNPNDLTDSYLNEKNKDTLYYLNELNTLEKNQPSQYISISSLFENSSDCASVMYQINATNFIQASSELNVNYTQMAIFLCDKLNILSLPDLAFMYNDIMLKLKNLQNSLSNKTYSQLDGFSRRDELYDLFTIVLLIYRPLRIYIKSVLSIKVTSQTNQFILLIAVFLSVNVVVTVVVFIIIKWYVFRKLNLFNESLIKLKQSFLM